MRRISAFVAAHHQDAGSGGIAISIPVMMRGRNRVRLVNGRPR